MLSIVFIYAQMQAPEICLRVFRVRAFKEAIFIHAQTGEINEIKALVASGQGSPFDSCGVGWFTLHVLHPRPNCFKMLISNSTQLPDNK